MKDPQSKHALVGNCVLNFNAYMPIFLFFFAPLNASMLEGSMLIVWIMALEKANL